MSVTREIRTGFLNCKAVRAGFYRLPLPQPSVYAPPQQLLYGRQRSFSAWASQPCDFPQLREQRPVLLFASPIVLSGPQQCERERRHSSSAFHGRQIVKRLVQTRLDLRTKKAAASLQALH
jgi:hypothetical protein